jgi:hypothetical protein
MKRLIRRCWLCGKQLMAVSHAEVKTPDGKNVLWVHKICENDTMAYFRRLTADLGDRTPNLQEAAALNGERDDG